MIDYVARIQAIKAELASLVEDVEAEVDGTGSTTALGGEVLGYLWDAEAALNEITNAQLKRVEREQKAGTWDKIREQRSIHWLWRGLGYH
jgi:hypothetical protein